MPPRNPEMPEGTDAVVNGDEEGGSGGFLAKSGNGSGGTTEKLVTQVREQAATLRGQATDKLRTYADDGKGKATGLLEELAGVIDDAARSIDQRLGQEYGDYAHRASGAVSDFAGRFREKSVDDLVDETRELVRKSPGVAIAAAAVVGFALMRVVRTGLDDVGVRGGNRSGGRSRSASRTSNTDTTTSGGA